MCGDPANKNPGATAIATGAEDVLDGVYCADENSTLGPILQTHWPLPPLLSVMEEAREWAAWAPPFQVEALALACYEQLPQERRICLITYLRDRVEVRA